jgi:hypothetical protein
MLEKMLNRYYKPDSDEWYDAAIGVDLCIGSDWGKVYAPEFIHQGELNYADKKLTPTVCKTLKTLITARQRIKIAEEKMEEAAISKAKHNKWRSNPPKPSVQIGQILFMLDSAIGRVVKNLAAMKHAKDMNVDSNVTTLQAQIEKGVSSKRLELCGAVWPLHENEMALSSQEQNENGMLYLFIEWKAFAELHGKNKKLLGYIPTTGKMIFADAGKSEGDTLFEKAVNSIRDRVHLYASNRGEADKLLDGTNPEHRQFLDAVYKVQGHSH